MLYININKVFDGNPYNKHLSNPYNNRKPQKLFNLHESYFDTKLNIKNATRNINSADFRLTRVYFQQSIKSRRFIGIRFYKNLFLCLNEIKFL